MRQASAAKPSRHSCEVQLLQQFFAKLLPILADRAITDVLVNSSTEIWMERAGRLEPLESWFTSESELYQLAKALVDFGGDHLDFANPLCDVVIDQHMVPKLADVAVSSLRIHAVIPASITSNSVLSIRVHRNALLELHQLAAGATLQTLRSIARSNQNFVISGGAGAGKTTLLKAMLVEQPSVRTVIIEDSPELAGLALHKVALTARPANSEGRGGLGLQRLLHESLRMRADRLVLGEVRSTEIVTLLQALNLGVSQVAFTIHASSASRVRARMLALWLAAGHARAEFDDLLADHKLAVIQLARRDGERVVEEIGWVT